MKKRQNPQRRYYLIEIKTLDDKKKHLLEIFAKSDEQAAEIKMGTEIIVKGVLNKEKNIIEPMGRVKLIPFTEDAKRFVEKHLSFFIL